MIRNDKIFRKAPMNYGSWKHYLREGLEMTRLRAKKKESRFDYQLDRTESLNSLMFPKTGVG